MAAREIIKIDEERCTGCGLCIPKCPEGAIQIIDGRARLISDLFCDGLGACIGHCPEDAITIEKREAQKYDERRVMKNIVKQGANVISAHLKHLREHRQDEYLNQAMEFLKEKNINIPDEGGKNMSIHQCPGTKMQNFGSKGENIAEDTGKRQSQLRQWPIQLHLISPEAPYYKEADLLLAADCIGYALGDFHKDYLKGKGIAIACPKLDDGQDIYIQKIRSLIEDAKINTITVMTMEVPCCSGLLSMVMEAQRSANRKVPVKSIVAGIKGDILSEEWL